MKSSGHWLRTDQSIFSAGFIRVVRAKFKPIRVFVCAKIVVQLRRKRRSHVQAVTSVGAVPEETVKAWATKLNNSYKHVRVRQICVCDCDIFIASVCHLLLYRLWSTTS